MGWAIVDYNGRPYVPRIWATEKEARDERIGLLRGYPADSEWRHRLSVQEWTRDPVTPPPKPLPSKKRVPSEVGDGADEEEDDGLSEERNWLRNTS